MAIDTREKRQSAVYFMRRHAVVPSPNAAKDQEWRQEVLRSYPGILADPPSIVTEVTSSRIRYFSSTHMLSLVLGLCGSW